MRIDAHAHVWNMDRIRYEWPTPDEPELYRSIEPPELAPLLREAGVSGAVLVQAADDRAETDYLLDMAAAHDIVKGVVGWVPLDRPDEAGRQLERLVKNPYFKGVRHLIHGEADPDWVVRDNVVEGLRVLASFGLTFDVVAVFPDHLRHVPALAEKVPGLRLALDHLAKPPIVDAGGFGEWASQLAAAAAYPNVHAKLSGLNTACDWARWDAEDWRPAVEAAFRAFGAERLMFGSDWPVANLAGDYGRVWEATLRNLEGRSAAEKEAVLGGTAIKFYELS
ncbi:amidohydrolase family protein [Cohnella ginsengisoli]|uniref:Amidohydrolase family protein n=1 Tax=Cohnella ginsengisoli TaxID=425004 RepID=A0A9X4KH22_9BACL|nr:amidohydrolase family protein [Cohnella ginsengisoli]MDG0791816.1 amidohydrolase family protein [Cohnella ginsengisoli]